MAVRTDTLEPLPAAEPPLRRRLTPREWVRENLLTPWYNAVLTVVFGSILGWALFRAVRFVFITARWDIVRRNLTNFMVLFLPRDQLWRVWVATFLVVGALSFRRGAGAAAREPPDEDAPPWRRTLRNVWPLALFGVALLVLSASLATGGIVLALAAAASVAYRAGRLVPPRAIRWATLGMIAALVAGYEVIAGFGGVSFDRWGGLMLTLLLAAGGILLSFPLGVLLALGRRSRLPAVRAVCVAYIEVIRGVPLITLLFMGFFALGLFLPRGVDTPSLVARALVALVLFTAAYLAEIVRGGLQGVPRGQLEAAAALGLPASKTIRLIVLPQALRAVIPGIVGQFISLFKDTSLVAIIGLIELLGVARTVTKQPAFVGQELQAETFVFVSFVYWVGAYWMSRESRRLERRLGLGER